LIPSLIPSQVWCLSKLTKLSDAEKRSHPEFSWTTPQKNGMEPQRWTPGTLEALQNWVNEVYVMVTWYQLFPSCFPLDLHIRYISHDKTSPKMFLKGLRFKGHVPTLHHVAPRSRRSQVLVPGPAVLFDWTQQLRLVHHWGAGKTTTELTGEPVGWWFCCFGWQSEDFLWEPRLSWIFSLSLWYFTKRTSWWNKLGLEKNQVALIVRGGDPKAIKSLETQTGPSCFLVDNGVKDMETM
jgi:hypothetical protein